MLDATSAYDCVVLPSVDVALRRLGAPEDFINFIRQTAAGHTRIVSTGAGVSDEADAFPLAGLAQGDPLSPALWVIVADMALSHARKTPPTKEGNGLVAGFKFADLTRSRTAMAPMISRCPLRLKKQKLSVFRCSGMRMTLLLLVKVRRRQGLLRSVWSQYLGRSIFGCRRRSVFICGHLRLR